MVKFQRISYDVVRVGEALPPLTKPLAQGMMSTAYGAVKSKDAEGAQTRVTVEFWCENQQGVKTMVGTASGLAAGSDRAQ